MEADISIWRKPGHFYFALTEDIGTRIARLRPASESGRYRGKRAIARRYRGRYACREKIDIKA